MLIGIFQGATQRIDQLFIAQNCSNGGGGGIHYMNKEIKKLPQSATFC